MAKNKLPSDYDYMRFHLHGRAGEKDTCISMTYDMYTLLLKKVPGRSPAAVSQLVLATARRLRDEGHTGTLSSSTRKAVLETLSAVRA